ncbi:hypothetical protein CSC75_01185 [Pseudoxanthomonas wuyuanensis]|nr:hypothetical protein CSC75_01185 [Pseudoxanthomonas wuyuanensis]
MPDGPAAVLNTPRWLVVLNALGTLGMVLGLAPSLLIRFFEPQMWMVYLARSGVWVAVAFYLPYFVRSMWVFARGMWRWKDEQVEQLDHDLAQFRSLARWLSEFPQDRLQQHLDFARVVQERLAAKIGLLSGSADRLGLLPIFAALFIAIRNWEQLLAIPLWQAMLGLFLVITWLIARVASLMRLRVQLYEMVLADAMESTARTKDAAGRAKPADRLTSVAVEGPQDVSSNH